MQPATVAPAAGPRRPQARALAARLAGRLPPAAVAAAALFWWLVFYPGLMSNDSLVQYGQAVTGAYTNIRPPVMSIILSGVLRAGGNIQHVMLAQCLAVLFGVYFLALSAARWGLPGLPKVAARYAALAVVAVLLTPISPLPFYAMTFWTDVWVMACCCWLGALWFQMMRRESEKFRVSYAVKLAIFVAAGVLMVLVRHNSIVLLPVVSGLLVLLVRRVAPWKIALPALLAPGLLYEGTHQTIEHCCHVEDVHLYRLVLGYELVGLLARNPEYRPEFPFTSANLTDNYREVYYPGFVNLYGESLKAPFWAAPEEIHREYERAALRHPAQLARVKFEGFRCHFVNNPCLRFHNSLDANEFGLTLNTRHAGLRRRLTQTLYAAFDRHSLRWYFTKHLTWLAVNLALLAGLAAAGLRKGGRRWRTGALIYFIPLGYYLSFYLASLTAEFRYMYPSDVFLQAAALGCLAGSAAAAARAGWSRLWRRTGPADARAAPPPGARAAA